MPVIKCRVCGAVATAQIDSDQLVTSYGASFRENCRTPARRQRASFVSGVSECPQMDAALEKLALRLLRRGRPSRAQAERASAETRAPLRNDRARALFSRKRHSGGGGL